MKEVDKLMGLGKNYKVLKTEEVLEEKQICKYIYVEKTTKKERCPNVITIQNPYMIN